MKSIILAAGRGSRMKGHTSDRPKCLLELKGKSLLSYQLSALNNEAIDEIIIVTGYKSNMLEEYGCRTINNGHWDKTNMVSSLLCDESEFDQELIVSYADIIYSSEIISRLSEKTADIVVVYDKDWKTLWKKRFSDPLSDAESFVIDSNGLILDIGQKVQCIDEIQGQYIGLMKFSQRALSWIKDFAAQVNKDVLKKMDMTTLLRALINKKYSVYGMPINGGWCEIDTCDDFTLASNTNYIK